MKKTFALALVVSPTLMAQEADIFVTADSITTDNPQYIKETKNEAIKADAANALEEILGITFSRKGGHGHEVIMRGQKKNGLNIKIDDKFLHGGCPNNMDPVTSYITPEFYDSIEVESGVTTLSDGRGGPAGSIRFIDKKPDHSDQLLRAQVGTGFEDNSNTQNHFAKLSAGTKKISAKGQYSYKTAQDYEDGSGENVLSSYQQQNSGLKLYWNPSDKTEVTLGYNYDLAKDVMYQGLMMNSPRSEAQSYQLQATHELNSFFKEIKGSAYSTNIDHTMDNANTSSTYYKVQVDSNTVGGKVETAFGQGSYEGLLGFDLQNLEQNINRDFSGSLFNTAYIGAEVNQWGLYSEVEKELTKKQLFKVGVRYDHVSAKGDGLSTKPSMMVNSALSEFSNVYGYNGDNEASESENNISALLRYTRKESSTFSQALSLSRTMRTADPYERYLHQPSMMASMRRTGNPGLKPEAHHQVDYSAIYKIEATKTRLKFTTYYNNVTDFITIDRARGQAGVLATDGRLVYRNVDATLWGSTLGADINLTQTLSTSLALTYTYGKNTTDNRALYEIPPFMIDYNFEYQTDRFGALFNLRSQLKQTRVDDSTSVGAGIDAGTTPGWAIVNLSFNVTPLSSLKQWKVYAGVNNLFDKTYARHLNLSDALTATQVRVNDPGRSLWLRTQYQF